MLERVKAALPKLAPAERRVAQLVLADSRGFSKQPIAELARLAQVSKPTVIRFCRRMGFDGLPDFRLQLAASLGEGLPFVHRAVSADDTTAEVVAKLVDNAVAAFVKYRRGVDTVSLARAAASLSEAGLEGRRIEFYGVGNSGIVAQDAQHKFFRLGVHTISYSDGHMQVMSASSLRKGDCLVLISNSGRTRDLMDACDIAGRHGATTIAITATDSPLAKRVDCHLAADHPQAYDRYSPMVSRLLHLMVIDVLVTCVALRIGSKRLTPLLREMKDNLRDKRYA